jgi:hypothetical protein
VRQGATLEKQIRPAMVIVGFAATFAVALFVPASAEAKTFTDGIGDSGTAPDITAVEVGLTGSRLTFKIDTPSEPTQAADSSALLAIDTDADLQTGGENQLGAEVLINEYGPNQAAVTRQWNGNFYQLHVFPSLRVAYSSGTLISVNVSDLGNPSRITLWTKTARGNSFEYGTVDWAPDQGSYFFALQTSDKLDIDYEATPSTPKAGRPFRLSVLATLAETGDVVEPESVRCSARVGGAHATIEVPGHSTLLPGRGTTGCRWRVPRSARGKKFLVAISVAYKGSTTVRKLLFRIR